MAGMYNMIIQITMFKNELKLLQKLLPIWTRYADGFVFYDDDSNDGSYEYLQENKNTYNILEIIRSDKNSFETNGSVGNRLQIEKDLRQPMFDVARKYSKNIICLDSDEYFDGEMTKQDLESLLESNPNTLCHFQWIQYTSCNTIRVDGPWKNNWKDRAGNYTKQYEFSTNYSHISHLPLTEKQIYIPLEKLFISHLQWLDKFNVAIKQYSYKVSDWCINKLHNINTVGNEAIDSSVANFEWEEEYFDYPLKINEDFYEDQNIFDYFRFNFIRNKTKQYNIPNLGNWGIDMLNIVPMYFCTVSDEKHFPLLINLIGSIHKLHFYETIEIGVFDLGMSTEQLRELNNIKKVKLYNIEKTNPQILDLIKTDTNREVRGLFSWKPVVIKQALDNYPYVLYVDAGTTLLKSINGLFNHIIENGYFITDCGRSIKSQTPKHIIDKFNLETEENKWLLDDSTLGIEAGLIGITKQFFEKLILPIYKLSFDINNFVDDGTCPDGWGSGRHDQTLFSILFRQLKLKIYNHDRDINECFFEYNGKKEPCYLTHTFSKVNSDTTIFRSRWNIVNYKLHRSQIKRKYIVSAITAIGPNRKYEKFIKSYFKNILQDIMFDRIEFIIVYSEWSDIFDKYTHFKNIIFIKEEKSSGIFNAFNLGIKNSSSEYITNWNIDDLRHPLNIKLKYDVLKNNIDVDMAYNYYVTTSTNENFYNIDLKSKTYLEFPDNYHKYVMSACLAGPDPVWRKTMNLFVGGFDASNYKVAGDWDMWIRFAKAGYKFKLIPEILCIFNVHENNTSGSSKENKDNESSIIHKIHSDFFTTPCNISFKSAI
jgi:hypothetical protein